METITVINTNLQELAKQKARQFYAPESDQSDIFPVSENYELASKILKSNPVLIKAIDEAFQTLVEDIVELIDEDLKTIWKRLDKIEEEIKGG